MLLILNKKLIRDLIRLKMRFAVSSTVATAVDYVLYLVLVSFYLVPVWSNVASSGTGMLINFALQKRFIFNLNRRLSHTFIFSISISLLGIVISTTLIYLLNFIPFLYEHQFITKALVIGIVFNYNFYMKRFAFERKFL